VYWAREMLAFRCGPLGHFASAARLLCNFFPCKKRKAALRYSVPLLFSCFQDDNCTGACTVFMRDRV
jgi:hypothetical protein